MGGRFTEDPELLAAIGGGKFQEDPDLLGALNPSPRGGGTVGGEVDPSIPPQPMPEKKGWMDALREAAAVSGPGAVLSAGANNPLINGAAQGLAHGVTSGADQGIPGYGGFVRDERAAAQSASPGAYNGGNAVGAALSPINALAKAGMVGQAASAGLQAGAQSYNDADPEQSVADRVVGAWEPAKSAAELALGIGTAGKIGGAVLGGVKAGAGRLANMTRAAAYGGTPGDAAAMAAQHGLPYAENEFVRNAERIAPPSIFKPQSPSDYNKTFSNAADSLEGDIQSQVGQAGQNPKALAQIDKQKIVDAMRAKGDSIGGTQQYPGAPGVSGSARTDAAAEGNQYWNGADRVQRQSVQSPADMLSLKRDLDSGVNYGSTAGTDQSFAGQANKFGADQARGQLYSSMDAAGQQSFPQTMQDYGTAATARDMALRGGARASVSSAPDGMFGAGLKVANAATGGVGPDLAASGLRGVETMSGLGQDATSWMAQQAPAALAAASRMSSTPQGGQPDPGQTPSSPGTETAADNGKGQLLPNAVVSNPQLLGPYRDQFDDLSDRAKVSATIERLTQTDPDFAMRILPTYQRITGGM